MDIQVEIPVQPASKVSRVVLATVTHIVECRALDHFSWC